MEPTDHAHLSWDALQHARSLAPRRMRPDKALPDPGQILRPPPAVTRAAITRGRVSGVAAPLGGVGHSGFGHSSGAEDIEEYPVIRYPMPPTSGGSW